MKLVHLTMAVTLALAWAAPASAQQGRVQGSVRDTNGDAIQGAVIRATHPDAIPGELQGTSDNRGRFAIIGMRTGTAWTFTAEAPGYFPVTLEAVLRSNAVIPLTFTLARDLGPMPGALSGDIEQQLDAANALRDEGRLDQAIAAYLSIQSRNARLTSIGLVLGDAYRKRAAQESAADARRRFLQSAIAAYQTVLKSDETNTRARAELASATAELQGLSQ